MNEKSNGAHPGEDLETNLRRAAADADATWTEREQQIRERLQNREEASRQESTDRTNALIEQFERQTAERSERVRRSSEQAAADVSRHLENLRSQAGELEAKRREDERHTLFGKVREWWMGLGKRKSKPKP